MPQISLYIDDETLRKIERAASKNNVSVSKWMAEQIRLSVVAGYPEGYESLFGSVKEGELVRPEQVMVPFRKSVKKKPRKIGILEGKAALKFAPDFKMKDPFGLHASNNE